MSAVRGLMIVVAGGDPARFHAALSVAAASAALDRPARIFVQADAVALLRDRPSPDDERRREAGAPGLAEMIRESLALGVRITACQSGLALAGLRADQLPEGIETGGLVEFLSSQADEQLLMA